MPSAQDRFRRLRKVVPRRFAVAALTAATAAVSVGLAPPAQAALPLPKGAFLHPASIDRFDPYVPQVSCDYRAKPGTVALRALMMSTYHMGADDGIVNTCAAEGMTSEHADGRAWDWGLDARVRAQRRVAMRVLHWLTAKGPDGQPAYNMRRLGIMYMIYNHRIYGQYAASAGWRPYTHCSGPTACHVNHIHFSLTWNGAEKRTSWWTGHATRTDYGPCQWWRRVPARRYTHPRWRPCPAPKPLTVLTGSPRLAFGAHGKYVYLAQQLLRIPMNGRFDRTMWRAVRDFRVAHHLPAYGVVTRWVWKALRAAPRAKRKPSGASTASATLTKHRVRHSPLYPYRHVVLRLHIHHRRPAVRALQRRLHLRPNGWFTWSVRRAVVRFQRRHHLARDGIVGRRTWAALGAFR